MQLWHHKQQRKSAKRQLGGGLSYTQAFGYDQLNRLTTAVESSGGWSQTNKYDRYGNRAIDLGGGNQSLYFNTSNRITNAGYVYDSAGNLTNDGAQSFGFDSENKIKAVNGVSDVYRYDGDGNRVRKNFATGEKVRMVYGGGQLIAEYDLTNGSLKKEYVYGPKGLIATIETGTGARYTTADHLGSPRVVTNSSAGVVSRHDYMPFGEEIGSGVGGRTTGMGFSVSDGLRQKFTSKERDVETGWDYFDARYYASSQGRFTTADEFSGGPTELFRFAETASENPTFYADLANPQSLNKYQYCFGNPLSFVDPTGHFPLPRMTKKTVSENLKEGAQKVGKTVLRTINGAASALSENNGLGRMDAEQNTAGRVIGHVLTGVQVGAEIYGGVSAIAAGAGEAIMTAPACSTGIGCAIPGVGVATIAAGAVVATHGTLVGLNTLGNIFSKGKDGHPAKDNSTQGALDNADDINANQANQRDAGKPDAIRDTTKANQKADTALKKIKRLDDWEDQ